VVGPTNGKIVLQRQTAHADAVAGLPLPGLSRTAEPVQSNRLHFLNTAQLPPFVVRVTGNDGFLTKSLLTKRLHVQFVAIRQFSGAHEDN